MTRLIPFLCAAVLVHIGHASATTINIVKEFDGTNGSNPRAGLTRDFAGHLYGTTMSGGTKGAGTVFRLNSPQAPSTVWSITTLFSFPDFASTGIMGPQGGRLFRDTSGRLYGATYGVDCNPSGNHGTAFRVTPPGAAGLGWTTEFTGWFRGTDGSTPSGGLIADGAGDLYGTTVCGGLYGYGTAYKMTRPTTAAGKWGRTTIHDFDTTQGRNPRGAGLVGDGFGNVYGTTAYGGIYGNGTVFRLSPPTISGGKWTASTLVDFAGSDGALPAGALIRDRSGIFYGTTWSGGTSGGGTVFSLTPPAAGSTTWTLLTLANFDMATGARPLGALALGPTGDLYGAARIGGSCSTSQQASGCGVIFRLTKSAGSPTGWSKSNLVVFDGTNGAWPNGDLLVDGAGKLYGTTFYGGASDRGVVFEITP